MAKFPSTEDLLLTYSFGILFSQCLRFLGINVFGENEKIGFLTSTQACASTVFFIYLIFHGKIITIKLTVMENLVVFVIVYGIDVIFRGIISLNKCSGGIQLLVLFYTTLLLTKVVQRSMQPRYVRIMSFPKEIKAFLEDEYPTYSGNLIFIWFFEIRGLNLKDINLGHASMQLAVDNDENYISNWPSNQQIRHNLISTDIPSQPNQSLMDDIEAENGNPHTIICIPENTINATNIYCWFKELKDNKKIQYNLLSNNCTYFIRSALLRGGLELMKPWVGLSVSTMTFSTDLATHIIDAVAYRKGNFWVRITYNLAFAVGFCKMILYICLYLQVVFYSLHQLFPNLMPVQRFPFHYNYS